MTGPNINPISLLSSFYFLIHIDTHLYYSCHTCCYPHSTLFCILFLCVACSASQPGELQLRPPHTSRAISSRSKIKQQLDHNKIKTSGNLPATTACMVVPCSIMDDSAFLWEHAIFGPPPRRNPLTDRYEILHD
jgi:hypothetical protein